MINRQNWLDVRTYLRHIEQVRQLDPISVKRERGRLRHLLEWADETLLGNVKRIEPTYSAYLSAAELAAASIVRGLSAARAFYAYARAEWPGRYRTTTDQWVQTLQPPRLARSSSQIPTHHFYTIDDVLRISAVSTETLRHERAKVAACMLFLSGMRADALATIPISCVDLANGALTQDPQKGVRTKNRKAAITYLLPIPELMTVVKSWNDRLRDLSKDALWYATLNHDSTEITETKIAFEGRHTMIRKDIRLICDLAGVPYQSTHKFRHGHVVYAIKQARNMAEMKAISQNVMHSSVTITDQVYGGLVGDDIKNTIAGLGQQKTNIDERLDELIKLLQAK